MNSAEGRMSLCTSFQRPPEKMPRLSLSRHPGKHTADLYFTQKGYVGVYTPSFELHLKVWHLVWV